MDAVTIIAYAIAIAIPAFTVYLFTVLDIFGTSKFETIVMCLAWGAFGAFGLAYVLNTTVLDQGVSFDTLARVIAPIIEELLKAAILIYLIFQPRFRYIVDGMVYGIAVGIGFALSENLFIYLPDSGSAVLGAAISRTLSTALMHATASALVGLALGRLRRADSTTESLWPFAGIALAITFHVIYNNVVGELSGAQLLLVAIGIGLGGGAFIGWQIHQGLQQEKARFAETLGLEVDVSTGERKAVQRLGGSSIESIFGQLDEFFGADNVAAIRRLLVLQANVGILKNNLATSPASDRLKSAWQAEIDELTAETQQIRHQLGRTIDVFVQSVFPSDDTGMQAALQEELGEADPTRVHTFDMFMRLSGLAETFTAEELVARAEELNRIEIFKHVSLANLENLSRAIEKQTFPAGHLLFDQGDAGNAMYLIEQGAIDILTHGRTDPLRTYTAGDVVGEFSLLDGRPRSAAARAQDALTVWVLQREVFMRFIQSRPLVVLAMLQYLAEKARFTTDAVVSSINAMTEIAQGSFQPAATPATSAPVATVELEPDAICADTPALVNDAFSQVAAALRESPSTG